MITNIITPSRLVGRLTKSVLAEGIVSPKATLPRTFVLNFRLQPTISILIKAVDRLILQLQRDGYEGELAKRLNNRQTGKNWDLVIKHAFLSSFISALKLYNDHGNNSFEYGRVPLAFQNMIVPAFTYNLLTLLATMNYKQFKLEGLDSFLSIKCLPIHGTDPLTDWINNAPDPTTDFIKLESSRLNNFLGYVDPSTVRIFSTLSEVTQGKIALYTFGSEFDFSLPLLVGDASINRNSSTYTHIVTSNEVDEALPWKIGHAISLGIVQTMEANQQPRDYFPALNPSLGIDINQEVTIHYGMQRGLYNVTTRGDLDMGLIEAMTATATTGYPIHTFTSQQFQLTDLHNGDKYDDSGSTGPIAGGPSNDGPSGGSSPKPQVGPQGTPTVHATLTDVTNLTPSQAEEANINSVIREEDSATGRNPSSGIGFLSRVGKLTQSTASVAASVIPTALQAAQAISTIRANQTSMEVNSSPKMVTNTPIGTIYTPITPSNVGRITDAVSNIVGKGQKSGGKPSNKRQPIKNAIKAGIRNLKRKGRK